MEGGRGGRGQGQGGQGGGEGCSELGGTNTRVQGAGACRQEGRGAGGQGGRGAGGRGAGGGGRGLGGTLIRCRITAFGGWAAQARLRPGWRGPTYA